jgi:hypothetical protein
MIGSLRYMFYLETFAGKESLIILGIYYIHLFMIAFEEPILLTLNVGCICNVN